MESDKLYIRDISGDEFREVTCVNDISVLSEDSDKTDAKVIMSVDLASSSDFTCEIRIHSCDLLSILCGKHITNNWLKMHDGVMRRRKRK